MSDDAFPQLPTTVWWRLRAQFKKAGVPKKLSSNYIATTLNVDDRAGMAYLVNLVHLGLVDKEGNVAELAYDWRDDASYAEVCHKILHKVYPEELISIAPPPNLDKSIVVSWIARHKKLSEGSAKNRAGIYMLLAEANLAAESKADVPRESSRKPSRANPKRVEERKDSTNGNAANTESAKPEAFSNTPRKNPPNIDTNIQLNIQIHIHGDVSNSQIEAIFASMSKHLKNQ